MERTRKIAKYPAVAMSQLLAWAMTHRHFLFVNGNGPQSLYGSFPQKLFAGCADILKSNSDSYTKLESFIKQHQDWVFGYFSYELKDETEALESRNPATVQVPHMEFVLPETVITIEDNGITIESLSDPLHVYDMLKNMPKIQQSLQPVTHLHCQTTKDDYKRNVVKIKEAIREGEFYEMNYCMEFSGSAQDFSPATCYERLNEVSPMPFSAFMRSHDVFLMSASPERFLKKEGASLISQPIKGTMRRSADAKEDTALRQALANSDKDKAENLMIVDLVRNDLARSSVPGSVVVDELFGIYTFKQVHQMISTIRSIKRPEVTVTDTLKNAFPMGSMTGAPKIRVMEEIDRLEDTARKLYSGAVGYFTPGADFDFNVVIRSLIYDQCTGLLSFHVGSAITVDSDPETEYAECMLKAQALFKALDFSQ